MNSGADAIVAASTGLAGLPRGFLRSSHLAPHFFLVLVPIKPSRDCARWRDVNKDWCVSLILVFGSPVHSKRRRRSKTRRNATRIGGRNAYQAGLSHHGHNTSLDWAGLSHDEVL